jgi:hydrogenase-4 component F
VILALLLVPLIAAGIAYLLRADGPRRILLVSAAVAHTALTSAAWVESPGPVLAGWLALDPVGLLILSITSALFLACSVYTVGYLGREGQGTRRDLGEGFLFDNAPEATFTACLLFFLAAMTLVTLSQRFGLLWVAIEATTLASAPLIYFHRHHRSLEATWKYLLICSVGIAIALLGNFFLAVAATAPGAAPLPLVVRDLIGGAAGIDRTWLQAALILFVVGYGTKMGLAPLHTWLPDAHSEAPSVVSALLSGALLNCAFLGILRVQQVCVAAGIGAFGQELLIGFGLLSMAVAAVFIPGQSDYKRMLAYSSIEHMGILALGVGIGGVGTFGALLHAIGHSAAKAMLFLTAGNILASYRSKSTADVRGVLRVLPVSGTLWVIGFLAITGSPPFGPFLSELTILRAMLTANHPIVAAAFLVLLAVVFVGMAGIVLEMAQGMPASEPALQARREPWSAVVPAVVLAAAVLVIGVYVPPSLRHVLMQAADALS